jgi:hypothetical protein
VTTIQRPVQVGDRVRFDDKRTSWLARAVTPDGRYLILTAAMFGDVYYTIIDWDQDIRGPMNVIGWGLSIDTTSGPDEHVDKAIEMLRPWPQSPPDGGPIPLDDGLYGYEVSRRGEVPLRITSVRRPAVSVDA